MTDRFTVDDDWQRYARQRFLVPFYLRYAGAHRFVDADVDTEARSLITGQWLRIEEKLWRAPRTLERFVNYPLETMSCTIPGRLRDGWMVTSSADILLGGFCNQTETEMDVHLLDMQKLKAWFWPRIDRFPTHVSDQINRSKVSLVPISAVPREILLWRKIVTPSEA